MWLHIPTSLFFPASECSTSDSTSLYQTLAASVTVSGKARQPRYWRLAWPKASWTKRLSTPTCDPSQLNRIVAEWLDSLVGSPAKTSALLADKQASTATEAGCSLKSSDLFASWNPSSGCFLKTSLQSSLFPQELPYSENLPRSGSMRSGQLFARPTVARRIDATEPSSWHTPRANECTENAGTFVKRNGDRGEHCFSGLTDQIANWPPPRGTDGSKSGPNQAGSRGDLMLPSAAAMWSTPNVPNGGRTLTPEDVENRGAMKSGKRQVQLENEANFWSTPNARDVKNPGGQSGKRSIRKTQQGWSIDLNDQAAWWSASSADTSSMRTADDTVAQTVKESAWPTPKARDSKSAEGPAGMTRNGPDLNVIATRFSHPGQKTPQPGPQSSQSNRTSRRRLNPAFVEWLMGLPIGYTACRLSGMAWSQYKQQLHSAYSRIVREFSND